MKAKEKILPLESLRGLAALSVVFFHFNTGSHFNNSFTANAWLMVDFFFVLSGFVIALNYQDRIKSFFDLFVYQRKRLLRLYPLHITVLLVFLAVEIAKAFLIRFGNIDSTGMAFTGSRNLVSFVHNLFLVHNLTLDELTWNYPSWSISAEFFTYLLFGIVTLLTKNTNRNFFVLAFVFVITGNLLLQKFGMGTTNVTGPLRCIYSFFFGVLVHGAYVKVKLKVPGVVTFFLFVSTIIIVSVSNQLSDRAIVFIPLLFGINLFAVSKTPSDSIVTNALSIKPLVFLGSISYGIYMWHAIVLYVIGVVSKNVFNFSVRESTEGVGIEYGSLWLKDGVTVLAVIMVVSLSSLSYRFIERRFMKVG